MEDLTHNQDNSEQGQEPTPAERPIIALIDGVEYDILPRGLKELYADDLYVAMRVNMYMRKGLNEQEALAKLIKSGASITRIEPF